MPKAARDVPPPLELFCLKALWSLQEGNVKDVQRIVNETRPLAYTTIMTVLERLLRKGKLDAPQSGPGLHLFAAASREEMRKAAIRELLESFFDGSDDELLRFLGACAWEIRRRGRRGRRRVGSTRCCCSATSGEGQVLWRRIVEPRNAAVDVCKAVLVGQIGRPQQLAGFAQDLRIAGQRHDRPPDELHGLAQVEAKLLLDLLRGHVHQHSLGAHESGLIPATVTPDFFASFAILTIRRLRHSCPRS